MCELEALLQGQVAQGQIITAYGTSDSLSRDCGSLPTGVSRKAGAVSEGLQFGIHNLPFGCTDRLTTQSFERHPLRHTQI